MRKANWWRDIACGVLPPPVNPKTVMNFFWSARAALNGSSVAPSSSGEGVQTITEQVAGTSHLVYNGPSTGMIRHQPGDDTVYTNTPQFLPAWHPHNGNFIYMTNSALSVWFKNNSNFAIAGAVSCIYSMRIVDFITNEGLFSGSNGFNLRDRVPGSGDSQEGGSFNTKANWASGSGHFVGDINYMNKHLMIEQERDGSGNLRMWVNGVPYASGASIAVGTGNCTNFFISSNGHGQFQQFHEGAVYSGLRDLTKVAIFQAYAEYYHGLLGTYPQGYPSVSLDNGSVYSGVCTWNSGTKQITGPSITTHTIGFPITDIECRLYNLTTATVDPGIETRTWVTTKKQSVDGSNFNKFTRGTDYGVAAITPTGVMYCLEYIAVDSAGNRQPIPSVTYPFLDNQA